MKLDDLPTPCLVLDRQKLQRNIRTMTGHLARHNVPLRPHMKTAKSIDVARLVLAGQPGGITVSTLAEAEYFAGHGIVDILYAVGITPARLDQVARLNADGANITVITDDLSAAEAIAAHPANIKALIEIDCGEHRGGVLASEDMLTEIADRLGSHLIGVMTHAGHSYQGRGVAEIARIAEQERSNVVHAADRLRASGHTISVVSAGSSPTGRHAETMHGLTEFRAGVYMFGDLFQAEIETHPRDSIALTVLTSVIGRRTGRLLIDAGALALSKDRSTEQTTNDFGFGLVSDVHGKPFPGEAVVRKAYQEHGVIESGMDNSPEVPIGTKLRILPNHACLTAAAHDRYYVVAGGGSDGGDDVIAVWPRMNGW
jgi:D-serine deaminase-like pyridoxal phosphate-dependent protein